MAGEKKYLSSAIPIALVCSAILYRIVMVFFNRLDTDEMLHLNMAWADAGGHKVYCQEMWGFPPLYWRMLELVVLFVGESSRTIIAGRLLSVLLSVLTMWRLAVLERRFFGRPASWLMPLLYTFPIYGARAGGEVRPDTLLILLFVLAIEYVIELELASAPRKFLAAGTVMGLATICKQTAFVMGGFLALFFIWNTWRGWGLNLRTVKQAFIALLFTISPVALIWAFSAYVLTNCPTYFMWETLLAMPAAYGIGDYTFYQLWEGLRLDPALVVVVVASLAAIAVYIIRTREVPAGFKLALVFSAAVFYLGMKGRPFGEHYFLLIALSAAFLGGAAVAAVERWRPGMSSMAAFLLAGLLAVNAVSFEPRIAVRGPPEEHFDRRLATIDFVLKYTPPGTPVLGSSPMWGFRPSGLFYTSSVAEVLLFDHYYPWRITTEQIEGFINEFISQPAVFVFLDWQMIDMIKKQPRIRAYVEAEYDTVSYEPGLALLGISRTRGLHVPRSELKPVKLIFE